MSSFSPAGAIAEFLSHFLIVLSRPAETQQDEKNGKPSSFHICQI